MSRIRHIALAIIEACILRYSTNCKEDPIFAFPEIKLHGAWVPISTFMYLWAIYIHYSTPTIGPPTVFFWSRIGRLILGIHKFSQKHECGNWERGRAVSFLGIFVSIFWYSVFAVQDGQDVLLLWGSTCPISTILWMSEWNQHSSHIYECFSNRIGTYICCNVYNRKKVFACFIRPSPSAKRAA